MSFDEIIQQLFADDLIASAVEDDPVLEQMRRLLVRSDNEHEPRMSFSDLIQQLWAGGRGFLVVDLGSSSRTNETDKRRGNFWRARNCLEESSR